MIRLRTKLYLSYIAIIVIFSVVIIGFINIILREQFANFAENKIISENGEMVADIVEQFRQKGIWDVAFIEAIGVKALGRGIIIKVKDTQDNIIWDARKHNNGLCIDMISSMSQNMSELYNNWNGEYVENKFNLSLENNLFGILEVGYIGPYYFNDNEVNFINNVNKTIYGFGVLFAVFSIVMASFIAKNLSKPIADVIKITECISKGNFKQRIEKKSNIYEFNNLAKSVNILSDNLQEQKRLRKRLSEDVAHELRTPITNLQSYVEAMVDGVWEVDENRLNSLLEESKRISRLIGGLEELEILESEDIKLNKSTFDFSKLLESIVFSLNKEIEEKSIKIKYQLKEKNIIGDRDKLAQVLINIIKNGIKYSHVNGCIDINIEKIESLIQIKIKDYGIGIIEEDKKYIFERFYRGDKSRNKKTGGFGIGLSISKAIIEAHKGEILVNSKLEQGAELIITIPNK